jgi:hypothetical protein
MKRAWTGHDEAPVAWTGCFGAESCPANVDDAHENVARGFRTWLLTWLTL